MNLKRILQYGYFPKELPPPFETKTFAEKSRYIKSKWTTLLDFKKLPIGSESGKDARKRFNEDYTIRYGSSQNVIFSLAKGIYSRRKLGIPNPKQFLDLSVAVVDNWNLLRTSYGLSSYSQSTPIEAEAKRSVRTKSKSWNNFKFELIEKSYNKNFELRLDISQFYPSIYTHSIPWAILGKEKSKKYFKIKNTQSTHWTTILPTDIDAQNYRSADFLDMLVRNCNDRQSVGLPIGPDTSFILAEVIGNRIDNEIEKKLSSLPHAGIRYYDDYYFYFNSFDEAQTSLKSIQKVLHDFQLETNESKVSIKEAPFNYTEDWALEISNFKFNKIDKYEIRNFFSILFQILSKNKKNTSWIVHYALGRFEFGTIKIKQENWNLFLSFLLQTLLLDPSNIDQIFKILLSYKAYINKKSKERISEILQSIIKNHLGLNHSFEVSWALWICKSLKLKCPSVLLKNVLDSQDSITKLVCLDLINSNLFVGRKPGLSNIATSISTADLFTNNWLFAYEAYRKNWLNFRGRKIIESHEFMNVMLDYDVYFYNERNQIKVDFTIQKPITPTSEVVDEDELPWYVDIEKPDLDDSGGEKESGGAKSRY